MRYWLRASVWSSSAPVPFSFVTVTLMDRLHGIVSKVTDTSEPRHSILSQSVSPVFCIVTLHVKPMGSVVFKRL